MLYELSGEGVDEVADFADGVPYSAPLLPRGQNGIVDRLEALREVEIGCKRESGRIVPKGTCSSLSMRLSSSSMVSSIVSLTAPSCSVTFTWKYAIVQI